MLSDTTSNVILVSTYLQASTKLRAEELHVSVTGILDNWRVLVIQVSFK